MQEWLSRYGARSLTAVGALVVLLVLCSFFGGLKELSPQNISALPLVAIGGVVVLVLLLTAVAMMFSVLELSDAKQALGLPEGSIRAVIALSLIVLFAILSIFLYNGVSETKINVIAQLPDTERLAFIKDHPNLTGLQSLPSKDKKGDPIPALDKDGKPIIENGIPKYLYDVTYSSTSSAASQDFAKQLLVLLGTLMTAITSFYLGANTATSARRPDQTEQPPAVGPTIAGFTPPTYSLGSPDPLQLNISGANLNSIANAQITKGDSSIRAKVQSSANSVTCTFDPNDLKKAEPGDWIVVIDDGAANKVQASTPLKLTD